MLISTTKKRALFALSFFAPIHAIRSTYRTIKTSTTSVRESYQAAKANLDLIRNRKTHNDSAASQRFNEAVARHAVDAEKLQFIQTHMRNRKRAGIVMFYFSFGSLLVTLLAMRPYLALCALIALCACWTFALTNAFQEQQIREKKLFSLSLYLKNNGYFHPLNWN